MGIVEPILNRANSVFNMKVTLCCHVEQDKSHVFFYFDYFPFWLITNIFTERRINIVQKTIGTCWTQLVFVFLRATHQTCHYRKCLRRKNQRFRNTANFVNKNYSIPIYCLYKLYITCSTREVGGKPERKSLELYHKLLLEGIKHTCMSLFQMMQQRKLEITYFDGDAGLTQPIWNQTVNNSRNVLIGRLVLSGKIYMDSCQNPTRQQSFN